MGEFKQTRQGGDTGYALIPDETPCKVGKLTVDGAVITVTLGIAIEGTTDGVREALSPGLGDLINVVGEAMEGCSVTYKLNAPRQRLTIRNSQPDIPGTEDADSVPIADVQIDVATLHALSAHWQDGVTTISVKLKVPNRAPILFGLSAFNKAGRPVVTCTPADEQELADATAEETDQLVLGVDIP